MTEVGRYVCVEMLEGAYHLVRRAGVVEDSWDRSVKLVERQVLRSGGSLTCQPACAMDCS